MISKKLIPVFLLLYIFAIVGCKKDNVVNLGNAYSYFPTQKGVYVIYDVDSVVHADNDNNNDDSVYYFNYQLKEVVDSTFIDGAGDRSQLVMRYRRSDSTAAWSFINVGTQQLSSTAAYRTLDNVSFHVLSFPMNLTTAWDLNDKNLEEEELCSYEALHESLILNGLNYDSTVSVLQIDDDNFVEKIYGYEIYAARIGLVYKERLNLRKINGIVVQGTEYRQRAVAHGVE